MFRQILIHQDDLNFQLIYWREDSTLPLQVYQLSTVTYGMTSSPYLANRVIQKLTEDEGHNHPLAARALQRHIFVDDCFLGHSTLEGALELQQDIINLMAKGGFELRKWTSNHSQLLETLPQEYRETPLQFRTPDQPTYSVLGLKWIPDCDSFGYLVDTPSLTPTKRIVLSSIAHLYDPSGWLAPVTFWAKALMQHLWTLGLQWDDALPPDLTNKWSQFLQELPSLETLRIPRYLQLSSASDVQLHGFCDASETGFACSVYIRCQDTSQLTTVHLLIAKSRVAPLKKISIPRLELCGAHLLSKLLHHCLSELSLDYHISSVRAWCDSSIVISWIHTPSYRLKTYVANRVAEIQELMSPNLWFHISSQHNPADCASRGLKPHSLIDHPLWWQGPPWLRESQDSWPHSPFNPVSETTLPDLRPHSFNALVSVPSIEWDVLQKFSSWSTLNRVLSYVLRFVHNTKSDNKIYGPLTLQELSQTTLCICKWIQRTHFNHDLDNLMKKKPCSTSIQRLAPFLDPHGIIRVGGRLRNAPLQFDARHPILLPKNHHVVNMLIDYYHLMYLHAGPQFLQSVIAQRFWIISSRSTIRSRVFKCIRCFRCKPSLSYPLMGDLPASRVAPTRTFLVTGVDYAGPFSVKIHTLRRLQPVKVYICIFICFSTKAIHIEVVTDLTTNAYIAALSRFVSRRGLVSDIYSDCGSNFIGTANHFKALITQLRQDKDIHHFSQQHSIKFHFLPARAPHQGGLWERAVKSAKHHLKRVIGEQTLTLEEFMTLTTRIEAILNSRPLTPLSSDPSDLQALTPGHFLIGGPLLSLPEQQLDHIPHNRLRRWQMVQAFSQNIWRRWQQEYLHTLQQRSKWIINKRNLKIGDLVVIHDENSPPLTWKLGRVSSVSPGADGIVRVIHLKTSTGTLSRPATKVSLLPIE